MSKARKIEGSVSEVLIQLEQIEAARTLVAVLRKISGDLAGSFLQISSDFHRVIVKLPQGALGTVRVTTPTPATVGSPGRLRFKPPADPNEFEVLYFGGAGPTGRVVVAKYSPSQLGSLKTVTLHYES